MGAADVPFFAALRSVGIHRRAALWALEQTTCLLAGAHGNGLNGALPGARSRVSSHTPVPAYPAGLSSLVFQCSVWALPRAGLPPAGAFFFLCLR